MEKTYGGRDQWLEETLNLQDLMSYTQRTRELFRKYGKVGLGVHLAIYTATLSGCYVAAERNAKLDDLLVKYGLLTRQEVSADKDPEKQAWTSRILSSSGSSLAVAFLCTKALLPVRVPLTLAITPSVARLLQGRSALRSVNGAGSTTSHTAGK